MWGSEDDRPSGNLDHQFSLRGRFLVIIAILLVAILLRVPLLNSTTGDTTVFVVPWYDYMRVEGFGALAGPAPNARGEVGGNYSPPYYYLLYLVSLLDGFAPKLWLVKLISFSFDLLAAFFAYRIARLHLSAFRSFFAAAAVLISPSVLANSAWWGQSDMMWTSLILGSLYYSLSGRFYLSAILFGIGLSLKAQAFFLAPFLFLLFVNGEMKIRHLACAPAAFLAMLLPAILAGRSPVDAVSVYVQQAGYFEKLSMNAPNLYLFVPDSLYAIGAVGGLVLTAAACFVLAILPRLRGAPLETSDKILAATMFVALAPFLLPKMHDRYFFAADVFSVMLAIYRPRLWLVPIMLQLASLAAYAPIVTWNLSNFTSMWSATLPMSGVLNAVTVSFLVYIYWRTCWREGEGTDTAVRQYAIASLSLCGAIATWFAVAKAFDTLKLLFCPSDGGVAGFICDRSLTTNLMWATAADKILFGLLVGATYLVARLWLAPWIESRWAKAAAA
jgi:Gpi18-like mannosyltransferase